MLYHYRSYDWEIRTQKRTRVFSLQSADGSAFEIKSLSCHHSSFSVLCNDSTNKIKQYWIEARFEPQRIGEIQSLLTIGTSHPDSEQIMIELAGHCFSDT
jgi:hypothetical protein